MTDEEYQRLKPVLEMAQRLHHKLHGKLAEKGMQPVDILLASFYATHNLAVLVTAPIAEGATVSDVAASRLAGVEWIRTAADNIERQALLDSGRGRAH